MCAFCGREISKSGETFCRFAWEPGELALADRAYFTPRGIQHVLDAGADVLVRYRLGGVELQDASGDAIDVLDAVSHLDIGETLDMDVSAKLPDRVAPGRLVAYRLPSDAVERAVDGPDAERLLGGELYAKTSRVDWATLLRRTFDVDVRVCPRCAGPVTVRAVVTAPASVRKLLDALRRIRAPPAAA